MFIELLPRNPERAERLLADFQAHLKQAGEFYLTPGMRGQRPQVQHSWRGVRAGRPSHVLVSVGRIWLTKAKPYCGNHPGECPVGTHKPMSRMPEWDDMVRFNNGLNAFLDGWLAPGETANVWSKPHDWAIPGTGNLFYIRKNNVARVRYEWNESCTPGSKCWEQHRKRGYAEGRGGRHWDFGSPSQFEVT